MYLSHFAYAIIGHSFCPVFVMQQSATPLAVQTKNLGPDLALSV
jgi:hypothetical protein